MIVACIFQDTGKTIRDHALVFCRGKIHLILRHRPRLCLATMFFITSLEPPKIVKARENSQPWVPYPSLSLSDASAQTAAAGPVASIASSAVTALTGDLGTTGVLLTATLFGATTFPIYSVAAAHAHDFADASERVELSAALMFFFALGAIAAPLMASTLIELYGPSAMFAMIGAGHAVLVVFGLIRMRMRPSARTRTRYVWAPRTSFLIGRLTGRTRDEE